MCSVTNVQGISLNQCLYLVTHADQMYFDDLPIWGMVGESFEEEGGEKKVFIYTHQKFVITWNGDRVSSFRSPPLL